MNTANYECGCVIVEDFVSKKVGAIKHCPKHAYLYDESKTLDEMADEIRELYKPEIK